MSDDHEQKTEQPTPKRLEEAHARGDVVRSQEIKHWFMLLGATGVVGLFGASTVRGIGTAMAPFLREGYRMDTDPQHLMLIGRSIGGALGGALALPFLALLTVALAGGLVQHRPVFAWSKLKPDFSRVSPMGGLKRLGSIQALVEFAKSLLKVGIVASVLGSMLWAERDRLDSLIGVEPIALMQMTQHLTLRLIGAALIVMGAIGLADYLLQRHQLMKRLRMSRQDIRDEMKQSEGDPAIKGKIRQLRIERSRRRMMAAIPDATVVIANPTHFAVALRYDADQMAAPRCVAKGMDFLALRIRKIAEENGVPVIENPPLARALHASAEIDRDIPPEHYRAVAQVIGYVMQLKPRTSKPNQANPSSPHDGGRAPNPM